MEKMVLLLSLKMLKQQQTPYANFWKILHSAREWAGLVTRNSWKNSPKKHLRGTSLCLSNERWKRLPKSPLPSASSHQQEESPASRKRITDESEPWNVSSQSCVSVSFSEIPSDPRAQVTRPAGAGRVTRGRRSRDPRARVAEKVPKRNGNDGLAIASIPCFNTIWHLLKPSSYSEIPFQIFRTCDTIAKNNVFLHVHSSI